MAASPTWTRRRFLGAGTGAVLASSLPPLLAAPESRGFRVGACDWSIGRRGKLAAMERAASLGLDGVQVSFGPPGGEHDLRKASGRKAYAAAADRHGVVIASLAMGVLNRVPYASSDRAEQWVRDCVRVLPTLGERVALLAFFGKGDIKGDPEAQKAVIRRLKKVAPEAEKAGVVLGIESWLSADEHRRIIDAVGSDAVKVYYDVANSHRKGYDIYQEIRSLGTEYICEFHMKENGHLLGRGDVDFAKVRDAIDAIGYRGWVIIEAAVPSGMDVAEAYPKNVDFIRGHFPRQP